MPDIFNQTDNAAVIARINSLTPATAGQWGKMNVAQMMAHCQVPLRISYGEQVIKGGIMGFLFGKMIKKMLLKDEPFKPNLPTFKEAKVAAQQDFIAEQDKLKTLVQRLTQGPQALIPKHPVFGPLTADEWNVLHYKHLDHHLRQFGV